MTGSSSDDAASDIGTPAFSYYSIDSSKSCKKESFSFQSFATLSTMSMKWKCAMLSKRKVERNPTPVLTDDDIQFLQEHTTYKEPELREWFREFIMDCPEGILTKKKVLEILQKILPATNGEVVTDLIFSSFDKDGNGWIDFNEFILATYCTANSSPADKLHWVFQMYDKDGSETIQLAEMIEVFGTLYMNEGLDKQLAVERAVNVFANLDVDGDGDITEDEFVRGCLQDQELVTLLEDRKSDPPLVADISADSTPRNLMNIHKLVAKPKQHRLNLKR